MGFIPYGKQSIGKDDVKSVEEVLFSDYLTTGPKVREFEEEICRVCGSKYAVAVSNGTAALHIASLAMLNKGDKVLTTPNSFLATSNAILYAGGQPVFIDIAKDGNLDLELCEEHLKKDNSIKAIYGVAFSGNMLDQDKLKHIRDTFGVYVLEDCAHSLGASWDGARSGSCENSDSATHSFHPVKHITSGEGGAVTTNSKKMYDRLLCLRNHGMVKTPEMAPWEYEMRELGFNYRLTDIQCALGLSQMKKLDEFVTRRIEIAKRYDVAFENTPVEPLYTYNGRSAYHLYVVKVDFTRQKLSRAELFLKLREKGIGVQVHYIPINKQPYYRGLGYGDEHTPNMDEYYSRCFSIPMYPALTDEEQGYVIETSLGLLA